QAGAPSPLLGRQGDQRRLSGARGQGRGELLEEATKSWIGAARWTKSASGSTVLSFATAAVRCQKVPSPKPGGGFTRRDDGISSWTRWAVSSGWYSSYCSKINVGIVMARSSS